MIEIVLLSMLTGVMAGILAGLFGIGGGLVIVPALVAVFKQQHFPTNSIMLMALGTSLATIIFTAWVSARTHHRLGAVLWVSVFRLAPGIALGTGIGAYFAGQLSTQALKWVFCGFLLWVALQMALAIKPGSRQSRHSKWLDGFVGFGIGFMSALVGVGGGTLTVPYLVNGGTPIKNAVATSSACGVPIALVGTVIYVILGWKATDLPVWSVGYVYLPAFFGVVFFSILTAPLGAKLAHTLPTQKLKRYFSLLLVLVAVKMVW